MQVTSESFTQGGAIPARCAFGKPGSDGPLAWSDNLNPQLSWSGAPAGTKSYAIICVDSDVPTVFDHVNQAGHVLAADMPRQNFIHWLIANIPAGVTALAEGSCSQGVVQGGKRDPAGPAGSIQGVNDYGGFMGDGAYHGYDGPCPPWNDALVHRYHFRVFALGVERLALAPGYTEAALHAAMRGHVLAEASTWGTYTLNPSLR
jgi:Raf kinase inhibitor-like YbhB/YbcL family protein